MHIHRIIKQCVYTCAADHWYNQVSPVVLKWSSVWGLLCALPAEHTDGQTIHIHETSAYGHSPTSSHTHHYKNCNVETERCDDNRSTTKKTVIAHTDLHSSAALFQLTNDALNPVIVSKQNTYTIWQFCLHTRSQKCSTKRYICEKRLININQNYCAFHKAIKIKPQKGKT